MHSFIHYSLDWSRQTNSKRLPRNACKCSNKNCVYLANSMAHPWRINTHTLTVRLLKDRMQKTINFPQSQQQSWKKNPINSLANRMKLIRFTSWNCQFCLLFTRCKWIFYSFINSFCNHQSAYIHFYVNNIIRKIILFSTFFSLFKLF